MKKNAMVYGLSVIALSLLVVCFTGCKGGDDNSDHTTNNYGPGNQPDSDGDGYPDNVDCDPQRADRWANTTFFPDDSDQDDWADSQNGRTFCVGTLDSYPNDDWTLYNRPDPCLGDPENICNLPKIKAHWAYPIGTWTASIHWDCARPNNPAQPWQIEAAVTGHDSDTGNEVIKVLNPAIVDGTEEHCRAVIHADPNLNGGAYINQCPWGVDSYFPSYNAAYTPPFCADLAIGSPAWYVTWVGDWSDEEPIPSIFETGPQGVGAHWLLWPDGAIPPDPDDDDSTADLVVPLDYDSDGFFNKCPDANNDGIQDDPHCIPDSCMMIANEWSQDCGADGYCSIHASYPGPDTGEKDTLGGNGNDGIAPECNGFDDDNDGCHNDVDPDDDNPLINCF